MIGFLGNKEVKPIQEAWFQRQIWNEFKNMNFEGCAISNKGLIHC